MTPPNHLLSQGDTLVTYTEILVESPIEITQPTVNPVTATLLSKDRARAADVLLQLQYQFSRTVSSIEVK